MAKARSIVLEARTEPGVAALAKELELPPEFTDRFELETELGRGASGVVLKAVDSNLARPVAIKFIFEAADDTDRARFLREGKSLSRVAHPNIVTLYDFDLIAAHPYLVMEVVDGGSLRTLLAREGRLAPARAVELLAKVLAGLAVCHEAGIVHRDVKPENVLLTRAGEPKLADLSIARGQADATRLTQEGGMVGTLTYMAPEQFQAGDITPAADLHAAGAMLYELLTGQVPFPGPTPGELVFQVINQAPPDAKKLVPEIPDALSLAIQRAMAKDPAARPSSARQMVNELEAALRPPRKSRKTASGRFATGSIARPKRARSYSLIAGALGAVLVAGGLAGVALVRLRERPSPPPPPPSVAATPRPSPSATAPAVSEAWAAPELVEFESRLDALEKHDSNYWKLWRQIGRDILAKPDRRNFGRLRSPHEMLTSLCSADVQLSDLVVRGLAHHIGRRSPTPFEVVLTARAAARQFAIDVNFQRLNAIAKAVPTTGGLTYGSGELAIMQDLELAPAPLVARLARATQQLPHALTAAVTGGPGAGPRVTDVIAELSDLLGWLRHLSGAAQNAPEVVEARVKMERAFEAPGPELVSAARRVARNLIRIRGVRMPQRKANTHLEAMAPDLARLGRELPANRERLERWFADLRAIGSENAWTEK